MQNVLRRALPGGLTNIVLIVGIELFYLCLYLSESHPIHPGYSADGSGWTAGAVLYFQAAGLETLDFAWRYDGEFSGSGAAVWQRVPVLTLLDFQSTLVITRCFYCWPLRHLCV